MTDEQIRMRDVLKAHQLRIQPSGGVCSCGEWTERPYGSVLWGPDDWEEHLEEALGAAGALTASEVKVLTETASKFGYELGRKEALTERPMWRRHRADVGEQIAEELEALNGPITPLAAAAFVRDLTSLPSGATSDATSGVPGHREVSEAVRSPQEPGEGS
jgi:hypothetical protein